MKSLRVLTIGGAVVLAATALAAPVRAEPDTPFNTNLGTGLGGTAQVIAVQPDGKIVVGGNFAEVAGVPTPHELLRLNADGTVDTAFNVHLGAGFDGDVRAVLVQPDGKVLVGGNFTALNGQASTPDYLVRLNANGTPDTAFNAHLGTGFDGYIYSSLVQPDGKIVVGGWFSALNGRSGTPNSFVRLNRDGTPDTVFNANLGVGFDRVVYATALQPNGKLVVGGSFASLAGRPSTPDYVMRLNANGTPDLAFDRNLGTGFVQRVYTDVGDGAAFALAIQPDGRILIGGGFSELNGRASAPNTLVRLNASGLVDSSFSSALGSGYDREVWTVATRGDGRVLVGGDFIALNGDPLTPYGLMGLLSSPGNVRGTVVTFPSAGRAFVDWAPPLRTGGTPITNNQFCLSACTLASHWRATLPTGARSVTLTGLVRGRTYTVQIRAVNAAGLGPVVATTFTQAR